jgi:endonuclease/exonuclease/phosphatase family metal-dependent hydrolase
MKKLFTSLLLLVTALCFCLAGCNLGGGNQAPDEPTGGDVPPKDAVFTTLELDKYKIVYDTDYPEFRTPIYELQNTLLIKYGASPSITADTSLNRSSYEILIGDTNRYEANGKIMEYSISVVDKKLKIDVGGVFSLEKAIEYLSNNVFTGQTVTLTEGLVYSKSFLTKKQAVTTGSTIRVMTSNVLAESFDNGSYRETEYRVELFAGSLLAYTPDVVGVQETDADWNMYLDKYLDKIESLYGIKYERYWGTYEDKVNYSSLIYRADKFTVGDSGVVVFSWWIAPNFNHSYHMRNVSWAQFKFIDNPSKTFILANTHWSYRTEHQDIYGTNELRTQCRNETNTVLTTLKNSYAGTPIFLTGDFNTSLSFFTSKNSGLNLTSSYNVISEQAKSAGTSVSTVPTSGHFDHIFGTGSYSVKRFEFFSSTNYKNELSDHPFVYADVAF